MLAPAAGNVSLRTVSSSRPQLLRTESQQSIAASDDYYSFSSRASTTRSASNGSRATVVRYATPNSHPVSRTSSPAVSRTVLAQPGAGSKLEPTPNMPSTTRDNSGLAQGESAQSVAGRAFFTSPLSETANRHAVEDSYAGRAPTPGMDDSPYIRFAINQLTREENTSSHSRQVSEAGSDLTPAGRLIWDENLGCFVRSAGKPSTPPAQQPLLPPEERGPQASVDPEAFVPVDPPEGSLLYPSLDFVPLVLRPWAMAGVIFCVLLMIAGIAFCNVWSRDNQGVWDYAGRKGRRYFVFEFLPQILAVLITIWTFIVQAAVYRVMPFMIMASERPLGNALRKLPILPRNFLFPDFSHIRHGEVLVGLSLLTIWLSNFIALPLLSCFFQAKWFVIDGQGAWRWAAVWIIGWILVAVYGLLAIGLIFLMFRFLRAWSGLMWDPVSLADLISVIQRSNILHDFDLLETVPDVGKEVDPRVLRLGYWQLSQSNQGNSVFYGVGEPNAPIGTASLRRILKNRREQPMSRVSFDVEQQNAAEKGEFDEALFAPSVRYRWIPWFLRNISLLVWTVVLCGLFIAFVAVSFVHEAVANGFLPRLPTLPSTGAFSSSNFLYSIIPSLIGNILFLAWQHIDFSFRALQPFATLSSLDGAPAEQSLLLAYPSFLPIQVTIQATINKHYKVAWISLMSILSSAIPILGGGVFISLYYSSEDEIRVGALMPAFYATIAFCALYVVSLLCIWPRRRRYLPHDVSTLADLTSFLYQSPLLSDKLLREPRSKTDLVTRLIMAPPGEKEHPRYGFGIYVGRDGREHLGIDRFRRPGRADMLITTGVMK